MRRPLAMTAHKHNVRETTALLERILERVESIEEIVEGIRDQIDDGYAELFSRDGCEVDFDEPNGNH